MQTRQLIKGLAVIAIGIALAAGAITVGELDDAPGASLAGIVLMIVLVVAGIRIARRGS